MRDKLVKILLLIAAMITVVVLCGIVFILFSSSVGAFYPKYLNASCLSLKAIFGATIWQPVSNVPSYGIWSMLLSTAMVSILALVIAVPISVSTAIFMSELASKKTRKFVKPLIELLASVPSVVFGFFGIVLTGPIIAKLFNVSHGLNAINGGILLAVMALPTMISISDDAIRGVPVSYRMSSLSLGASKWQTISKVVLPAAKSGILAAIMLGLGRVIGETMTVLMACGGAAALPQSFLSPVQTITATIATELGEVTFQSLHYHALFFIGLVLFLITFAVNLVADIILVKNEK